MQDTISVRRAMLIFICLTVCFFSSVAVAKKPPKAYPEEGKVIGTGVLEHQVGMYSHTYTLETGAKVYLLDCDKRGNVFHHTGEECGGNKRLQVGDTIHFRVEKEWLYIPVTETSTDSDRIDHTEQTEQRLRVLREELKPTN